MNSIELKMDTSLYRDLGWLICQKALREEDFITAVGIENIDSAFTEIFKLRQIGIDLCPKDATILLLLKKDMEILKEFKVKVIDVAKN